MPVKNYYALDPERYKAAARANYAANREARRAQQRTYRAAHKEQIRRKIKEWQSLNRAKKTECSIAARRKKHGFTRELYAARLESQRGACAICEVELKDGLREQAASADHCHVTNKPRGILCKRCNLMLGHARDRADILRNAIAYLEKWA